MTIAAQSDIVSTRSRSEAPSHGYWIAGVHLALAVLALALFVRSGGPTVSEADLFTMMLLP
jgi:hypothetical protein